MSFDIQSQTEISRLLKTTKIQKHQKLDNHFQNDFPSNLIKSKFFKLKPNISEMLSKFYDYVRLYAVYVFHIKTRPIFNQNFRLPIKEVHGVIDHLSLYVRGCG